MAEVLPGLSANCCMVYKAGSGEACSGGKNLSRVGILLHNPDATYIVDLLRITLGASCWSVRVFQYGMYTVRDVSSKSASIS